MNVNLRQTPSTPIATQGTESQVITACPDLLLQQDETVEQAIVLQTLTPGTRIVTALQTLQEAFVGLPNNGSVTAQLEALCDDHNYPLADVDTSNAARAAFHTLYRMVWSARRAVRHVNL